MDEIIKKLSERMATQPSRRGFVATLSKIVLGMGVALTGASTSAPAVSAADDPNASLRCCTGTPCSPTHNTGPCPRGQHIGYRWFCLTNNNQVVYTCVDCYDSSDAYQCTYYHFVA
jgi:hypothetical protein